MRSDVSTKAPEDVHDSYSINQGKIFDWEDLNEWSIRENSRPRDGEDGIYMENVEEASRENGVRYFGKESQKIIGTFATVNNSK